MNSSVVVVKTNVKCGNLESCNTQRMNNEKCDDPGIYKSRGALPSRGTCSEVMS